MKPGTSHDRHERAQRLYFEQADQARFRWTTGAAGFAETEDALLSRFQDLLSGPCLEIGCGEGNNLVRLSRRARCVGVDLYRSKLSFAAGQLPSVRFAAADAASLPFRNGVFGTVFIRDLLHHVPRPEVVLTEAVRVLAEGGRLCLLEPNGRNPLLKIQARLIAAEAGILDSTPERLARLVRELPVGALEVQTLEPLQLRRLLLHYRFGLPALGRLPLVPGALAALERGLSFLIPRSRWAYVCLSAERR